MYFWDRPAYKSLIYFVNPLGPDDLTIKSWENSAMDMNVILKAEEWGDWKNLSYVHKVLEERKD